MAQTDPVPWDPLVELGQHTSLQCEAVFEDRRGDLDPDGDRVAAVGKLYEWWHDRHGENLGNEQGGAYVFAYLLEREGLVDPGEAPPVVGGAPAALLARRPDDPTLERWFWAEEQVPWWIAVRCGVHYSLVQYWLYEADVPLMRRNVPDRLLERVEDMGGGH